MKNAWNDFIKPIVVLGAICLVTSALLAVTNEATAPIIQQNAAKMADAARQEVLPAATSFTKMDISAEGVTEMYKADNDTGYVITAQAKGYGGEVPVMVAFDAQHNIVGVKFMDNNETPGLGQKVKEPGFQNQFANRPSENFGLSDIDAISGATISSSAAVTAVNNAISAYNTEIKGEEVVELTPEELRAKLLPDAGEITPLAVSAAGITQAYQGEKYGMILYLEGPGFYKKPIYAAVAFDDNGVITGVWVDASNETKGVGQQVGDAKFVDQFIGQTGVDGVEAVAGATVSSDAVKAIVQNAIDAYQTVKEA